MNQEQGTRQRTATDPNQKERRGERERERERVSKSVFYRGWHHTGDLEPVSPFSHWIFSSIDFSQKNTQVLPSITACVSRSSRSLALAVAVAVAEAVALGLATCTPLYLSEWTPSLTDAFVTYVHLYH